MVRYNTRAKETKEKLNVVGHNIRAKEGETMLHKTLHRKTKDQATGAPLNNSGCSGRVGNSCSTRDNCRDTAKRHEHHLI